MDLFQSTEHKTDPPQPSASAKARILIGAIFAAVFAAGLTGFLVTRVKYGERQSDAARPMASQLVSASTMLPVSDLSVSEAFYQDKLGFELVTKQSEVVLLQRANLRLYLVPISPPTADKPEVTLAPSESRERTSVNLVLGVKGCRRVYEELRNRGVEFLSAPQQLPWGGWRCFTRDPDGYLIEIWEDKNTGSDVDLTPFL